MVPDAVLRAVRSSGTTVCILQFVMVFSLAVNNCNMTFFLEHIGKGVSNCPTCYFPIANSLSPADYEPLDFSNKWVYFAGDSTLRQFYGEFVGVLLQKQVGCPPCLVCWHQQCLQLSMHMGTCRPWALLSSSTILGMIVRSSRGTHTCHHHLMTMSATSMSGHAIRITF